MLQIKRREKKRRGRREREKSIEINFKELVHKIIEAAKSKFCRVGQQAGDPGLS